MKVVTEILILLSLMKSINKQQLTIENNERIQNVSSQYSTILHDSVMKCLNTIYCYYMYILNVTIRKTLNE
jgi:hypothetical protein